MQGVIKAYDPESKTGSLIRESDLEEIDLAANALDESVFRFLRQGQRVNFEVNDEGRAINLRFGSEADMKTSAP
jgi:cold shock CspA family protein